VGGGKYWNCVEEGRNGERLGVEEDVIVLETL